jgi:hypothetical protein
MTVAVVVAWANHGVTVHGRFADERWERVVTEKTSTLPMRARFCFHAFDIE